MSSTMIDSSAVFKARLRTFGIPEDSIMKFCTSIDTMGKLAVASSSQPGMGDEGPFLAMIVKNLALDRIGDLPDGELAGWRRVWYESHTIAVADLRSKVERTEDSAPRRIPIPERAARLLAQQKRLNGVAITGALVPSYSLVDYVVGMREEECLKYVEPSKCTVRSPCSQRI